MILKVGLCFLVWFSKLRNCEEVEDKKWKCDFEAEGLW